MRIAGLVMLAAMSLASCVSVTQEEASKPPVIAAEMDVPQLVDAGLAFGDKTLEDVKKALTRKKAWPEAHKYLDAKFENNLAQLKDPALVNAVNLLQTHRTVLPSNVVATLVISERPMARRLGWELAARYPSREMAKLCEKVLTDAIARGEEVGMLMPEMAEAVRANQLSNVYTLVRIGLFNNGDPAFAKAMAEFDSEKATRDFLDYLARADIEDLRQLHQKTIHVPTAIVILRHINANALPINHQHVDKLFLYAVSRNQALGEYANSILEKNFPRYKEELALALSRMPVSIQVAFIEGSRRETNPNINVFLGQLRKMSGHREVIEEIEASKI